MSTTTSIEWTDVTDNIIVVEGGGWWCRRISPGCDHCYAEALNQNSFFGGNKLPYRGPPPSLKLRTDIIDGWARQRKPKKHFVSSMTDIFGEWVSREMIFAFLDGMRAAPLQTFQLLTKRPAVMLMEVQAWLRERGLDELPENIWAGATAEDQERANERVPELQKIPASTRFLSCEPLLGEIDLGFALACIDWVIIGGESGQHARETNLDWIDSVVAQCSAAEVPCFVKQLGSKPYFVDLHTREKTPFPISDRKGANITDSPRHFVREFRK
ncbi:MAG: phage Gp37/Gp68 family protein [Acidobacteria bacterium]|nr:phage Gp37/Gp68 family protein [Acidobacteriota bacterium]